MNNFLKYPLTDNKNKIIKFEDIKSIKLGGFVSGSDEQVSLYRNIGTKTYREINGTPFFYLKDELVPLTVDFDNDFANEPGPIIRFIIDHNNTVDERDNIYSNYYFDIEDKIVVVVNDICYSPDFDMNIAYLLSVIPESIILRNGEEFKFGKYSRFAFYKNNDTEMLVSTDVEKSYSILYLNATTTLEQEDLIVIDISSRSMTMYIKSNHFIISQTEHYNEPSEDEEEEGEGA